MLLSQSAAPLTASSPQHGVGMGAEPPELAQPDPGLPAPPPLPWGGPGPAGNGSGAGLGARRMQAPTSPGSLWASARGGGSTVPPPSPHPPSPEQDLSLTVPPVLPVLPAPSCRTGPLGAPRGHPPLGERRTAPQGFSPSPDPA